MNDLLQPGQHLDPDQLNAFAEGVLPEHERIQTLAHLADCPHCRQIVFLAQQAQQSVAPVPVKAATRWQNWFRFSPLSMLGAASAALACALIVTVALHLNHNAPPPPTTETAKSEPIQGLPPVTRKEETLIPKSAIPARPETKAVPLPRPPSPALPKLPAPVMAEPIARPQTGIFAGVAGGSGSGIGVAQPAPQNFTLPASSANEMRAGAVPADTGSSNDKNKLFLQQRSAQPSQASAAPAPTGPASSSASVVGSFTAGLENLPLNGRAKVSGTVLDQSGAVIPGANITLRSDKSILNTVSNAAGQFTLAAIPSGEYTAEISANGFLKSTQELTVGPEEHAELHPTLNVGAAAETVTVNTMSPPIATDDVSSTASIFQVLPQKQEPRPLPSKLPTAITVSSGLQTLAVDSAGTLFFSENGGMHWKAVEPQWRGKVIQLAVTPQAPAAQKRQAEAKDKTERGAVAGPVEPSRFQLTTDAGVVWDSSDGMHWQQR